LQQFLDYYRFGARKAERWSPDCFTCEYAGQAMSSDTVQQALFVWALSLFVHLLLIIKVTKLVSNTLKSVSTLSRSVQNLSLNYSLVLLINVGDSHF